VVGLILLYPTIPVSLMGASKTNGFLVVKLVPTKLIGGYMANKLHYRLCIDFESEQDMKDWCNCEYKRMYKIREMDYLDNYTRVTGVRYKRYLISDYAN